MWCRGPPPERHHYRRRYLTFRRGTRNSLVRRGDCRGHYQRGCRIRGHGKCRNRRARQSCRRSKDPTKNRHEAQCSNSLYRRVDGRFRDRRSTALPGRLLRDRRADWKSWRFLRRGLRQADSASPKLRRIFHESCPNQEYSCCRKSLASVGCRVPFLSKNSPLRSSHTKP